ncbi:MAG: HD domain-containing protein [Treponema sp.]|nr:HD domain-containing protein [Treponema sp.]
MKEYEFYDCLYGRQLLNEDEYKLILVPELQRLRYIRLSNIDSISLTGGSNISRYEHSIGTFFLAREWCNHNQIEGYAKRCITKAALYHDICSAPFGHSFQYIFEDNTDGSTFEHQNLRKIRDNNFLQEIDTRKDFYGCTYKIPNMVEKDELNDIDNYINGNGTYGKLISSDIDLDNIDNVIRLSYHIGILESSDIFLPLNLIHSMKLKNQEIVFTEDSIPFVKRWYEIRKKLYELLLTKWSDFSEKAMLTYALEICYFNKTLTTSEWNSTDSDLLNTLYRMTGEEQEASRIAQRLIVGDLYFPYWIISIDDIDIYSTINQIENKRLIEKRLKEKTGVKFIFHPILDKNKTNRVLNITLTNGEKTVIGEKKDQLLIGLFTPNEMSIKEISKIQEKVKITLEESQITNYHIVYNPLEEDKEDIEQGLFS